MLVLDPRGVGEIPDFIFVVIVVSVRASVGPAALRAALGQEGPVAHVRIPGEASPPRHEGALVGGLDRDDEVGAVGHHHVRHLV